MTRNAMVNELEIIPRVIIYKQSLRVKDSYEQMVVIKNNGLYPRSLKYLTDSPLDTTIEITEPQRCYIQPDETRQITIHIKPKIAKNINRRRHIYIESEHPNVTFEIPIIVVLNDELSMPESIVFSRSPINTTIFYEFTIYNPSKQKQSVVVKSLNKSLGISPENTIPVTKKDYVKVLLSLHVKDMKMVNDEIKIKAAKGPYRTIGLDHNPIRYSLYLNTANINFDELKYNRKSEREFTICNESQLEIDYTINFLNERTESKRSILPSNDSNWDSQDSFEMLSELDEFHEFPQQEEQFDLTAFRHFGVNNRKGKLQPDSCQNFSVLFQPVMDFQECSFPDDLEPPFLVQTKLIVLASDDEQCTEKKEVVVTGLISGPEVQFLPNIIDFREIYLGEEHCQEIKAVNMDGTVNATVHFKDYTDNTFAGVTIEPAKSIILEPCQSGIFNMSFFTYKVGKFVVKLRFKVKNRRHYQVLVQGTSQPVEVKTFPDILQFGNVPVGVLQRRLVFLLNPLAVPMTLQCTPSDDDGEETPLVLNIADVDALLPITINDPSKQLECYADDIKLNDEPIEFISETPSVDTYRSVAEEPSMYSTEFEGDVLDTLPEMAIGIVNHIKKKRLHEGVDSENRIMETVMKTLLNCKYFANLSRYSNYVYMDWSAMPTNPKEIYCASEIVHLKPNMGKYITVMLIPNKLGYHKRFLNVRLCPYNEYADESTRTLIKSEALLHKLWIEYDCLVPDVVWCDHVSFHHCDIYAGQDYEFAMKFENQSNVGCFLYFDVVPSSDEGEMHFSDGVWKYYLPPDSDISANCSVSFKKLGDVKLSGVIKFVGETIGRPFHLTAHVLPVRVKIFPSSLYRRQCVLEYTKSYVYIDNITPTVTWLKFTLKDEYDGHYLEPKGGILGPNGQGTYLTIHTKYYDPGIYKNVVNVQFKYGCSIRIPITYKIEGIPIHFEPLIEKGLNAGVVLRTSKENFYAGIPNFAKDIKVINRGRRAYRLIITKLKSSSATCEAPPVKGRLNITPKTMLLEPGTEACINITANAFEEMTVYNEFRIEILDQLDRKKFHNICFVATARFIRPKLVWQPKQICMNYHGTDRFEERTQIKIAQLINIADIAIDTVNLKVYGPFKIKVHEHNFAKEVECKMDGFEKREITILLNKAAIKDNVLTKIEGRIVCWANATVQKSLPLKVNICSPELKIFQPNLIIFTKYAERDAVVEIENIGCVDAQYKWKKVDEYTEYVEYFDDVNAFSRDIFSDIFGTLDLSESDSMDGSNMTEPYQTYRCKLKHLPDQIGIKLILDEIIDQLDLQRKRYMLQLNSNNEALWRSFECEPENVLRKVIDMLKLEDSSSVAELSSDDCFKERSVYFYEKSGTLKETEKAQSLMHLPAVRRGYALKANFQLDIVGGRTQNLSLTLAHLAKTIDLWKDNSYLGIKPWYELYKCNIPIRNVTPYTINIRLEEINPMKKGHRIADGFLKITSDQHLHLPMYGSQIIRSEGIMGFSEVFARKIQVLVNDGNEMEIQLRGQGVMPMLSVTGGLSLQELDIDQIVEEYKLLQCMYYFDIFKGITEDDEDIPPSNEEEDVSLSDYSIDSTISSSSSSSGSGRTSFEPHKTFVLVNHNAGLPNAMIVEQQMETLKFLNRLHCNKYTSALLHLVYQDYVTMKKSHDTKMPVNLKHFTAQPLPFHLRGHTLNMDHLKLNQCRRFEMYLQFFGPGKLMASARTAIKIPGLFVNFEVIESFGGDKDIKFIYYASDNKASDIFDKRYRNMYEREEMDLANDSKLKHAHSFDVDSHSKHQREISSKARKNVHNYYNSLNKSVYLEHKHHFVLSKIFSNSRKNLSGAYLRLILLIKPQSNFYEEGQLIEDYLFIDLHLGPTLPILLRGTIIRK